MTSSEAAVSLVILVGGDALALRVCEYLCARSDLRVIVVWGHATEFAERVERCGARFVARSPDDEESLRRAGVEQAASIVMLTDDDNITLHVALKARDLNPKIRIVLRQFNRTLGRKIEQNLENCSVISLSAHVAAFYAGTALDYECFHALQFPDIDGPLVGFSRRDPEHIGHGERLIIVDEKSERAIVFGRIRPNVSKKAPALPPLFQRWFRSPNIFQRLAREYARIDTLLRVVIAFALTVVLAATLYFAAAANLDWLQAFYFVVTTMTTTGFSDQPAQAAARPGLAVTIFLMLSGVALTGVFYAVLTTKFTQAQWTATQGLRHVARSGHFVVCGTGNVGSRVIDYLTALGRRVVAVEAHPSHEIVERARDNHFDLLTGDATQDATLDLCSLAHAEALIALTDSDTNNLEVALGARARNARLPIVMRCQEAEFASAIARHFGIDHTYGTAPLAAPAIAGLARFPGARGRVTIGAIDYEIVESPFDAEHAKELAGAIPLAVWRNGHLAMIFDYAEAKNGDVVLLLRPGSS
jgi:Trk K+ transport system NAD-binding subunit